MRDASVMTDKRKAVDMTGRFRATHGEELHQPSFITQKPEAQHVEPREVRP